MQTIIDEKLVFTDSNFEKVDGEYYDINDKYDDMLSVFKEYSVRHTVERKDGGITITILEQKISLDEIDMNNLFFEISQYFSFTMSYGFLGQDVDFCICLERP